MRLGALGGKCGKCRPEQGFISLRMSCGWPWGRSAGSMPSVYAVAAAAHMEHAAVENNIIWARRAMRASSRGHIACDQKRRKKNWNLIQLWRARPALAMRCGMRVCFSTSWAFDKWTTAPKHIPFGVYKYARVLLWSVQCPRGVLAGPEGRPWSAATCSWGLRKTRPHAKGKFSAFSRRARCPPVCCVLLLNETDLGELRREPVYIEPTTIGGYTRLLLVEILLDFQCQCSRFIAGFNLLCANQHKKVRTTVFKIGFNVSIVTTCELQWDSRRIV